MCDYCKPCGTAIDDYPVFEDMWHGQYGQRECMPDMRTRFRE